MNEPKRRHFCPSCLKDDGLWESVMVPGWRSINGYLQPEGERDINWSDAEPDSWADVEIGCSCGWEGRRLDLQHLGIDGLPLRTVHPNQMEIAS